MVDTRIKIGSIVANQLPLFIKEEFPLVQEFLLQYYEGLEFKGGTLDILQNIDLYSKLDELTNLNDSTITTSPISFIDDIISVQSTRGFPDSYGLIKIDSEIITYTSKTTTTFNGCVRGFSGISSYRDRLKTDHLVFSESESSEHPVESVVENLSILFLREFFKKLKYQISPGFEDREFDSNLNENLFLKQVKDFYSSKGTNDSFRILFGALYGEKVEVIKPRDYLFKPSDSQYRVTRDIVVESIQGNPLELKNRTLFQDQYQSINKAYGSVTDVERIIRGNKEYYVLSLDYDFDKDINVSGSIFGDFSIHPKTKLTSNASIGSTVIDVDSTVGFGTTGTLVTYLENGTSNVINYESKSLTQFFGCSGVDQSLNSGQDIFLNTYAYGFTGVTTSNPVKLRVTGVLSDLNIPENTHYFSENNKIKIKSLGKQSTNFRSNNWFFNIPVKYQVENISLLDISNYSYSITTKDSNNIVIGDTVRLLSNQTDLALLVSNVISKNVFIVNTGVLLNTSLLYTAEKLISKVNSKNYPELNIYSSNVQNVYEDSEGSSIVASPSLPNYVGQELTINDRSITFSGTFDGENLIIGLHGFYTGDSIYYSSVDTTNSLNIPSGTYFVKRVDKVTIKLAYSRENIYNNNFIKLNGTVSNNKIEFYDFYNQKLQPQNLLRKISNPLNDGSIYPTVFGPTGILVNGVEILNYKSKDVVFYGPIESVDVLSGGDGYDVINPPTLSIDSNTGSGSKVFCEVNGSLSKINIIDQGFDYIEQPSISIFGGNGSGALARPNLYSFEHSVRFNASQSSELVNLTNNTIGFSTFHKFRDGEKVIYNSFDQSGVGGLSTGAIYYAHVLDDYTIKLHPRYEDSVVGINTIDITSYGNGVQEFLCVNAKKKIGNIDIINPGSGYKNKKVTTNTSGINTFDGTINIKNHGYKTGDVVIYQNYGNVIGGLTNNSLYYLTSSNKDSFRLSNVGVGSTSKDFYFKTNQYVNLNSVGLGTHVFNYEPITVVISGATGISTRSGQNFSAIVEPIFKGTIDSVFVSNGGDGYGSEEIINYNRQPLFTVQKGSNASVIPIINRGKISEVLVSDGGSGYNCPPNIVINGTGAGAVLTPIVENGSLKEVKVISGGVGFSTDKTTIEIESSGQGANFVSQPKKWTINLVERYIQSDQITDDDGVIDTGISGNYGLEYTHLYAPRKLRQSVFSSKLVNGKLTYIPDLILENNEEVNSTSHSPIIGWAYDGNPIYGPYGYSSKTGGSIRQIKSGYGTKILSSRPNTSIYPKGFFVEDYEYKSTGDLDKFNGRFCITPEFPNGVYAYFATVEEFIQTRDGKFKNYKKPSFPYFIGNDYKSKPIEYNYISSSNQDQFNLTNSGWLRNITPYNINYSGSEYDFIVNPNEIKNQISIVNYSKVSGISSIGISSGGNGYKVTDQIIFDNRETFGSNASAEVKSIKGKKISSIVSESISINNIEFSPILSNYKFVGVSTAPHLLENGDYIKISGLSTNSSGIDGNFEVGVSTNTFVLQTSIGSSTSTGIVTYFNVYGTLRIPYIDVDDVLQIDSEQVKVLSIDSKSSRIKVFRSYNNTVGSSHSASTVLYEKPRRFDINVGFTTSKNQYRLNKTIYFDPQESLGIGTIFGVGIGSTVYFKNPGVGITSLFVPTKSIYLKNHEIVTGTKLVYSNNGGTSVSISTDGATSSQLIDGQFVYAAKISNDLIGISTQRVGLGSTGVFVGINSSANTSTVYFIDFGSGDNHSFKTVYDNVLSGNVDKNRVIVSTSSTHGLLVNDYVDISCISGLTTTYTILYNDQNRRLVSNPKSFISSQVNINNNTITINNHGYLVGQKVIHVSSSPSGGLKSQKIYYIIIVDNNNIKLSESYYDSLLDYPREVDITSSSSGTLYSVNPPISELKNQSIVFDLSDSSLSYIKNSTKLPAFEFKLYYDSNFNKEFDSTLTSSSFEVVREGVVGVDSTAKLTLNLTNNVNFDLYYKLNVIDIDNVPDSKKEIINDSTVINSNKLIILDSKYTGNHKIVGVGSTTFAFNIFDNPERISYSENEGIISYTTDSTNAFGEINDIIVRGGGFNYKYLPGISSISSIYGTGAITYAVSNDIGKIQSYEINDIGFDYSVDSSIRPVALLPQVLRLENLSSFKKIGISSVGRNYSTAPNLIAIDGTTGKLINDVSLSYQLGSPEVRIIKNTKGISNSTPKIIPVNNSNGVGINSITFNSVTKDVTVGLAVSYSSSSDYPFSVGDKVLIENTSVGVGSTNRGYNSSSYNYQLFTITSIDPKIGGSNGTITYNIKDYLKTNENPGVFNLNNSAGIVVPEKYFPQFNVDLQKNQFLLGETVKSSSGSYGVVENWNSKNEILTISSSENFYSGDLIIGETSSSQSFVSSVESYECDYNVSASSIVKKGWNLESGFLNNDLQRLHDSDYYQYFSYSIKSKVTYEKWNNPVSSLNHTAGFKKFSDLIIETKDESRLGISTEQNNGDFLGLSDIISYVDLNCVNDFDLCLERSINIPPLLSNEIILNSKVIQDYIESVGNRVLIIDNISNSFNSNPRSTQYSVINTERLNNGRVRKFITYVRDKRFTGERQVLLVSVLQDGTNSYINQYGRVETVSDMGSFDYSISGDEGSLLFYPTNYSVNDFDVSFVSYNIKDSTSSVGVGTYSLGDVLEIKTTNTVVPASTTSPITIVGIASTYRSSKVLVEIGGTDGSIYEYDELTVIHDNSDVEFIEYGQLTNHSLDALSSSGLGTYSSYLSGSNLVIDFTPKVGITTILNINTLRVSIASTGTTGVGTETFSTGRINSSYVSIASSTSPVSTIISSYPKKDYSGSYYIVSVEDKSNNRYQVSEVIVVDNGSEVSITEFGELLTHSTLGEISANIVGSNTELYFTPISGIDVEVRVFQNSLRLIDVFNSNTGIDLLNASISSGNGTYQGTDSDIKRSFDLSHKQNPIFTRSFDGSSSSIVDIQENTIRVPNHFFVTGEELTYVHAGSGTIQAIGITTTIIIGIGTTSKLPSTVYAVKVDDLNIKLASSATNALKTTPDVLDITSVGIGTSHRFISKNQNSRVLISIDNMIQSPIVATSITTRLVKDSLIVDNTITVDSSGISSFFGGDLIKVDSEIMKINTVGFGSTNVFLVDRGWMGTGISTYHPSNTLVTKVTGDYNIVENTLNFVSAPYGRTPIGTSTNEPSQRDYIGIETYSTFSGRTFLRSAIPNTSIEPYSRNYIFDDISSKFTGVTAEFTLKSNGSNVNGISTSNAIVLINDIFQQPQRLGGSVIIPGDYTMRESVGITSIQFTGSITSTTSDINTSNVPVGGIIVSVGSTVGYGYQPLVSAGGTAIVSVGGTISSISIGNSGSGYRSGIQTVNVGVYTGGLGIVDVFYVGVATVANGNVISVSITNPGSGYTNTNPPLVYFDAPLSYSNLPLIYSNSSIQGIGSQATIDIVVGQGSSVIDFEIKNLGYGYGQGEILTVSIGGTVGIPTNTNLTFNEFNITIDRTQNDKFSSWSVGDLQVIDSLDDQFDGSNKSFAIKINGQLRTIRSKIGSLIDVQATLLVFINDILQVPGEGYTITGGSYITFTEAPKVGDKSNILFYKGTGEVDTSEVDILETIKEGDSVRISSDNISYNEEDRVVSSVRSTGSIITNNYVGPGITEDQNLQRPLIWCRQTEDKFINGKYVSKDRILYEPLIYPATNIIQPIGVGSTTIFVESVKTFFDNAKENTTSSIRSKILIISQDSITSAAATAVVSSAGTISSIVVSDGGVGYSTNPSVIISNPVGLGTTQRAQATSTISSGVVTSITITSAGSGYTTSNPPQVLIESPTSGVEQISGVSYSGDFGIVVGIKTTNVGLASTGIVFDLYIPQNSFLRDSSIVGTAITISGIQTGYYFVVSNSNVGNGVTSLDSINSIVGIGTSFLDNVYHVSNVSIASTLVPGVGVTFVSQVTVSVTNYNGLSGIGYSNFYGEYSWGRIVTPERINGKQFNYYNRGIIGITTSAIIERYNPLRYLNYN